MLGAGCHIRADLTHLTEALHRGFQKGEPRRSGVGTENNVAFKQHSLKNPPTYPHDDIMR